MVRVAGTVRVVVVGVVVVAVIVRETVKEVVARMVVEAVRVVGIGGGVVVLVAVSVTVVGMVVEMVVGIVVGTVVGMLVRDVIVDVNVEVMLNLVVVVTRESCVTVIVLLALTVRVDVVDTVKLLLTVTRLVTVDADSVVLRGGRVTGIAGTVTLTVHPGTVTFAVTGLVTVDTTDATLLVVSVTVTVAAVPFFSSVGKGGLTAATQYDCNDGRPVQSFTAEGFYDRQPPKQPLTTPPPK